MTEPLLGSELDAMVNRYLAELSGALSRLPASQRDHLVGEIREHIVELRAEHPVRDRSDMEALLNRVGLPEDIAAVALEGEAIEPVAEAPPTLPMLPPPPPPPPPRPTGMPMRTLMGIAALVVVLVVGSVALAGGFRAHFVGHTSIAIASPLSLPPGIYRGPFPPVSFDVVPNVEGLSKAQAETALQAAGLTFTAQSSADAATAGTVIAQAPMAGATVPDKVSVAIVVSSGPAT